MTVIYKIQFFTYWHTSSGLSSGVDDDLKVMRNADKLPTIKGRTLKGLLSDAAYSIHSFPLTLVSDNFITDIFGKGDDEFKEEDAPNNTNEDAATKSNEGKAFFGDANVSDELATYLKQDNNYHELYRGIASTAIERTGVAKTNSLRKMEVTVPLTLYAKIEDVPKEHKTALEYCFQWVKRMGLGRTRGLGYCEFSIVSTT